MDFSELFTIWLCQNRLTSPHVHEHGLTHEKCGLTSLHFIDRTFLEGGHDFFQAEGGGQGAGHGQEKGGGIDLIQGTVGADGPARESVKGSTAMIPAVVQADNQVGGISMKLCGYVS